MTDTIAADRIEAAARAMYEEIRKDNPQWSTWEGLPRDSESSPVPTWHRLARAALTVSDDYWRTRALSAESILGENARNDKESGNA